MKEVGPGANPGSRRETETPLPFALQRDPPEKRLSCAEVERAALDLLAIERQPSVETVRERLLLKAPR